MFRRLTQALGIAKPPLRFGNPLVGRGHDHAQRWLRLHALVPQGTSRSGVFPCDFGVSSVLLRVSGCDFVPLFSLRPSGLPFPPPGVFPFGQFGGRFLFFFLFLPCSCILHLFSLG